MKYTNFILTVIAVLLLLLLFIQVFPIKKMTASDIAKNINIESIGGQFLHGKVIDVKVRK